MPRLVVVIDEFATLVKELPDFGSSMVDVALRGRTLVSTWREPHSGAMRFSLNQRATGPVEGGP
jgi:hypothetical protein